MSILHEFAAITGLIVGIGLGWILKASYDIYRSKKTYYVKRPERYEAPENRPKSPINPPRRK